MLKSVSATAVICAVLPFASGASAQLKAAAVEVAEAEAIVKLVSVDRKARIAVVRAPTGVTLAINVPAEAQNLDQVKPGDLFRMRYIESMAVALQKGGAASASEIQTVELAPKGGTPGGKVVNTKRITATVEALDRAARTLAVQGPRKNVMALKVAADVRSFDDIAVGDTITLTYTEALAMEMIPRAQGSAAKAER